MQMHNPPHPGEFIMETYLQPHGLSSRFLAQKIDVSASTLNRLLRGQSGVSPEMALRLSIVLGRSAQSWLAMQQTFDLWQAAQQVNLADLTALEFDFA
jgi:addiction module HigA family antidote